jgi:nucleotide-binding universal stress UspA family protein
MVMSKKIMVPLDGSPFSERALPLAVAIAHRSGAELRLVHVVVPLANKVFIEEDGGHPDYLDDLARRIARESGVRAVAERRAGRQAVGELSYYSAEEDVDLVVMATHGWGGLQRAWLGSVTDGLIREARVPVIAFRPAEEAAPRLDGKAIEEILVPLDGSNLSESILAPTLELGGVEARYTLVRVVPIVAPSAAVTGAIELDYRKELVTAMRESAAEYLSGIADRLRAEGYEVRTRILMHPQPARAILSQAREIGADLIALATHGRGGIARFALGSVADKVLRGADTPVLVVRGEVRERVEEGVTAEDPVSWKELVAAG